MLMANRGNELGIRNSLLTSTPWAKKRNINFHPFQIAVYFSLFFSLFFNKVFKTVSLVWLYCGNQFISRVFQLILVKLLIVLCFYNNKSRGTPRWGVLLWEEGSGNQDLRVVVSRAFFFQVFFIIISQGELKKNSQTNFATTWRTDAN